MCNSQGCYTVDGNNIPDLVLGCQDEGDGNRMALSDIVDQDSYIETIYEGLELGIVAVVILRKVHGEDLGLDGAASIFVCDFAGKSLELGFGARDQKEVEAFLRELYGVFFANSVRGTSDNGPGAFGSIAA